MEMRYRAKLSEKYFVSENKRFLLLKFELTEPSLMSFRAGQYISLKVNEMGERRSYSIASTPDVEHGFSLLIEIVERGKGSEYLQKLELGEIVEIVGPLGNFWIKEDAEVGHKLFVATGSGIVPIWSMINDLLINKKVITPIRLHWGMRSESDLFWVDNLARLCEYYPNFVYDIVLSKASLQWELCQGHVQDCLERDFGKGELASWQVYVCGNKEIVQDIVGFVENKGVKISNIYYEKFT